MAEEVILGSAVQIQNFSTALNGNLDKEYAITVQGVNTTGSNCSPAFYANGTTNIGIMRQALVINNTTISASQVSTTALLQLGPTGTIYGYGNAYFNIPKTSTGEIRYAMLDDNSRTLNGVYLGVGVMGNITAPASGVNITKLGINAGIPSGLGPGTVMRLWVKST